MVSCVKEKCIYQWKTLQNSKDMITQPKTPKSIRVITMPDFLAEEFREYCSQIDDTTLEKSNEEKKDKQEDLHEMPKEVQKFVNQAIVERMGKVYSKWNLEQDKESVSEIEKKY